MTRNDNPQPLDARIDALCKQRGIDRSDLPDFATVEAMLNGDYA
jgi:hypothetical protein